MALVLNEEQRLLRDTAREFLAARAPVAALRELRDRGDALGYAPELWRQMAELGWAGILLPGEYGGTDFGFTGAGLLLEECGRTLAASPLFATAVLGASAILLGGNEAQKNALLPALAAGELTFALALEESHHHRPDRIGTRLTREGDGYLLDGSKTFVLDGHSADRLIVVARRGGTERDRDGLCLAVIARTAPGVECRRTLMADSRNAANLRFSGVRVAAGDLLGTPGGAADILEVVLDRGRIAMAAEMMGCALEAFERTVTYLKERRQFGVAIGAFQALQHRAAQLQAEIELCRSVVLQALAAADGPPDRLPLLASLAKARLNELAKRVTNEAVQMHGGIGVTDELDIGLFLKRARVAMQVFGDTGYHHNRYAALSGY